MWCVPYIFTYHRWSLTYSAALIFCEQLVTLSDEIRFVWRRKLTMSSLVFLLNRYILLAYGIINVIGVIPWTTNLVRSLAFSRPAPFSNTLFHPIAGVSTPSCSLIERFTLSLHRCASVIMLYTIVTLSLYTIPASESLRCEQS